MLNGVFINLHPLFSLIIFQFSKQIVTTTEVIDIFYDERCSKLFIAGEASTRALLKKGDLYTFKVVILVNLLRKCCKYFVQSMCRYTTDKPAKDIAFYQLEDSN